MTCISSSPPRPPPPQGLRLSGALYFWTSWVGRRAGVHPSGKFHHRGGIVLSISASSAQGSKGGASWKGCCLGCDESLRPLRPGPAWVLSCARVSLPPNRKFKVNEKASAPLERGPPLARTTGCFHIKAPLPVGIRRQCPCFLTAFGFLPAQQGWDPLGSFGGGLRSSPSPSWS